MAIVARGFISVGITSEVLLENFRTLWYYIVHSLCVSVLSVPLGIYSIVEALISTPICNRPIPLDSGFTKFHTPGYSMLHNSSLFPKQEDMRS